MKSALFVEVPEDLEMVAINAVAKDGSRQVSSQSLNHKQLKRRF